MTTKTVELKAPHRHAGRDYPVGAKLTLQAHKAAWLIGLGRADEVKPTSPADKPKA